MKVYINKITGVDDACVALMMSKRSWTRESEQEIRDACFMCCSKDGFKYGGELLNINSPRSWNLQKKIDSLIKWGVENGHTTLLRFIDISITVEGLHRAAQDDFDSHAARLDNRIVRASTRLATFADDEKSEWYQDKILYPFEAAQMLGIELPAIIDLPDDTSYIKTDFGYVRADIKDDKDAKRGLYPLAIPSNFICKVQYPELCHIVQHRDKNSHANPELKEMIEQIKSELTRVFPELGNNLNKLVMEPGER